MIDTISMMTTLLSLLDKVKIVGRNLIFEGYIIGFSTHSILLVKDIKDTEIFNILYVDILTINNLTLRDSMEEKDK